MRVAFIRSVILAALLALPAAHAADDLMTVYREAVRSDPVLRQAEAARAATAERLPQARSALLPSLSASGSYNWTETDDNDWTGSSLGLQASQPIFRYSALVLQRQARALVSQADLELEAARQELILRVAERYFAVLAAESSVRLAEAELTAIERQLEQAEQRLEVGLIPITDVEEARARRDLARSGLIVAENDRASALEALRELTGREHVAVRPLPSDIPLWRPDPADPAYWREAAEAGNPRLQALRRATEASRHQINVQRGDRYPSVDLTASASRDDSSRTGRDPITGAAVSSSATDTFRVGVQVQVPLFQGGRLSSQVREAEYRHTEIFERLQEVTRNIQQGVHDAYRGVESSRLQVRALEQALRSTQRALNAVEAGFRAGTRTTVDVLDAQREYFRAEAEYASAIYNHVLSTLQLRQLAGDVDVEDLERINAMLESA